MKQALLLPLALSLLVSFGAVSLQGTDGAVKASASLPTGERMRQPGWWPTKGDAARKAYAGSESCAQCHQAEASTYARTSMARAASRANDTGTLRNLARIEVNSPPFLTTITRAAKGSRYSVGRGGEAMQGAIGWTMGDGLLGETFILESAGSLFESQMSYYPAIHGLDLTPGHTSAGPRELEKAFGIRLSESAAQQCFACHTTQSSLRGKFDAGGAIAGVGCESCHGPGVPHVAAMSQGQLQAGKVAILNPATFDPVKLVDYCGACHRSPMDVAATKILSPIDVRFQPYRLAKSRCWTKPDARLACTACHNPHEQVIREESFYDSKCLACHGTKDSADGAAMTAKLTPARTGEPTKPASCPVSRVRCTSCHMPKYKVSEMHGSFTDHDIRVVRQGDPYPL